MLRTIALFVLLLLVFAGCKKKQVGEDQYVTLYYEQTSCADPWVNSTSDSITKANVATYLSNQGLYFTDITIKLDRAAAVCTACVCKTGKIIYVSIFNDSVAITNYLQIGFMQ